MGTKLLARPAPSFTGLKLRQTPFPPVLPFFHGFSWQRSTSICTGLLPERHFLQETENK